MSVLALCSSTLWAQKVVKTISTETCACFKKDPKKTLEEQSTVFQTCFGNSMVKNADAVKKELKIDISTGDEAALGKLGELVGADMAVTCPEFLKYAMALNASQGSNAGPSLDSSSFKVDAAKAKNLKTGKYKYEELYLAGNFTPIPDSTLCFEFQGNGTKYFDYSEGGKKVYVYSVIWKSPTVAELKLLEKRNITDDAITKIGDKVIFTIKNTENGAYHVEHFLVRVGLKTISKVVKK